jgi:hypothetical protein
VELQTQIVLRLCRQSHSLRQQALAVPEELVALAALAPDQALEVGLVAELDQVLVLEQVQAQAAELDQVLVLEQVPAQALVLAAVSEFNERLFKDAAFGPRLFPPGMKALDAEWAQIAELTL